MVSVGDVNRVQFRKSVDIGLRVGNFPDRMLHAIFGFKVNRVITGNITLDQLIDGRIILER